MRSTIARVCLFGFGILMMVCAMEGHALASTTPVPEIDGASLAAGLAAATSAVLILRSRRRTK
jgi:hypothetical protein